MTRMRYAEPLSAALEQIRAADESPDTLYIDEIEVAVETLYTLGHSIDKVANKDFLDRMEESRVLRMALEQIKGANKSLDELPSKLIKIGRHCLDMLSEEMGNVEYMFCIIRRDDSTIYSTHLARGELNHVNRRCDIKDDHNGSYKGTIHIHPVDLDGSGGGFGFSLLDFYQIHKDGDHIAIVLSVNNAYALYRTLETRREEMTAEEIKKAESLYDRLKDEVAAGKLTWLNSEQQFNYYMCSLLGYVFYEGPRKGPLRKKRWTL